jgi:hypothetical protein
MVAMQRRRAERGMHAAQRIDGSAAERVAAVEQRAPTRLGREAGTEQDSLLARVIAGAVEPDGCAVRARRKGAERQKAEGCGAAQLALSRCARDR